MGSRRRAQQATHEGRESIGDEHWEHTGVVTPNTPDKCVKAFIFQRPGKK